MPRLVAAPRPGRRAEARAVRHQVADLHLRDIAERIVREPQLRHVLDDRIVERQQAAIAQLHDRDAGEGLGDRGPVIDRVVGDRLRRSRFCNPSFCRATICPSRTIIRLLPAMPAWRSNWR